MPPFLVGAQSDVLATESRSGYRVLSIETAFSAANSSRIALLCANYEAWESDDDTDSAWEIVIEWESA